MLEREAEVTRKHLAAITGRPLLLSSPPPLLALPFLWRAVAAPEAASRPAHARACMAAAVAGRPGWGWGYGDGWQRSGLGRGGKIGGLRESSVSKTSCLCTSSWPRLAFCVGVLLMLARWGRSGAEAAAKAKEEDEQRRAEDELKKAASGKGGAGGASSGDAKAGDKDKKKTKKKK